jgi:AraC-like DNA-binding protein
MARRTAGDRALKTWPVCGGGPAARNSLQNALRTADIASGYGFIDLSYFDKTIRGRFGMPPGRRRRDIIKTF